MPTRTPRLLAAAVLLGLAAAAPAAPVPIAGAKIQLWRDAAAKAPAAVLATAEDGSARFAGLAPGWVELTVADLGLHQALSLPAGLSHTVSVTLVGKLNASALSLLGKTAFAQESFRFRYKKPALRVLVDGLKPGKLKAKAKKK